MDRTGRGEGAPTRVVTSARVVSRAALRTAWLGPLVAQLAVGVLVRPPEYFNPLLFLPTCLVALVLVGPGSVLIGVAFAEMAGHGAGRRVPLGAALLLAIVGGMAAGFLNFEALALVLGAPRAALAAEEVLTIPAVKAALMVSGAVAAVEAVRIGYKRG